MQLTICLVNYGNFSRQNKMANYGNCLPKQNAKKNCIVPKFKEITDTTKMNRKCYAILKFFLKTKWKASVDSDMR